MGYSANDTVPETERFHDLDAVRALALLLGVGLHGVMSFMTPRFWIIGDVVQDTGANLAFYVIHMFRMTTFFVLAGFFAHRLMQKRGLGGFVGNRLKRVAAPLVIFWPFIMVSIIVMLIIANTPAPGTAAMDTPPPPPMTVATFPLTHLWFLYVLLWLYAGAVLLKLVTDGLRIGGVLGRLFDRIIGVLTKSDLITAVLIIPVAIAFYLNNNWVIWLGIQTPDTGLIPNAMALAGYSTAFAFGWWLNRRTDLLVHLANRTFVYGFAAMLGTWWCLGHVGISPVVPGIAGHEHPVYCVIYPLTAWAWTFALIGLARILIKRENPMLRYVSDASFWIFIVHLPLLMVFQYLVKDLNWEVEYKAAVVIGGTIAMGLLSYQIMVRYTFIGAILNGRRRKDRAAEKPQEAIA
jgi:glucans biosynthesis protein C